MVAETDCFQQEAVEASDLKIKKSKIKVFQNRKSRKKCILWVAIHHMHEYFIMITGV